MELWTFVHGVIAPHGKGFAPWVSNGGGWNGGGFMGSLALMLLSIFGGIGFLHWKKTRDDMREQVRGILAEYMPLEDSGDGGMNGSPMDFAHGGGSTGLIS